MEAMRAGDVSLSAIAARAADRLKLSQKERAEVVTYDKEALFVARTRLALVDLQHAELVQLQDDGYRLTESGEAWSEPVTLEALNSVEAYASYRSRRLARRGA